jgi:hypothetical protein
VIGKREQAGADVLLARVAHVTDDSIPLFTSDQLPAYRHALLNTYGEWYDPQRKGSRGALIPNRGGGHLLVCSTPRSSNSARVGAWCK